MRTIATKGTKGTTALVASSASFASFACRCFFCLPLLLLLSVASFTGCFSIGKKSSSLQVFDLSDQRVSDLTITKKITGKKEFLFFSANKTGLFLEGYIQGTITDYLNNPIEGVVVRAVSEGGAAPAAGEGEETEDRNVRTFESSSFDPGISDSNGLYRIRFSLPLIDKRVNMRGRLIFNPGWEQQKANLGRSYEPQAAETNFRLYYDAKTGLLAFGEGVRKSIVQPVGGASPGSEVESKPLPGAKAPTPVKPAETVREKTSTGAEDDIFKGFGFSP